MLKDGFRLYRYAQAQVANLIDGKLSADPDEKYFCDLETKSGKKLDIKACRIRITPKNRSAHYSLNHDRGGVPIKDRVDFLVCLAYDENMKLVNVLLVPTKELPEWETSLNVSIAPHRIRRSNPWYKFMVTLEELRAKLK